LAGKYITEMLENSRTNKSQGNHFIRKGNYINNKHIGIFSVLCLLLTIGVQAQLQPKLLRKEVLISQLPTPTTKPQKTAKKKTEPQSLAPVINPLANKNATLVYLENSETLSFDKIKNPDVQVLKGSVRFRHDNALMYCDSAYFLEKANSLNAFGHVRIVQGDTLFVYGDMLYYDGNTKLGRLRHNVRLINRKTTLTTDSLNYDRAVNLAYYYTGGKITDPLNNLTSTWGQYSPATNEALFKKNVKLKNKNFILESDTLTYNTKSSVANIVGETHILYNKETDIYTHRGWYNTNTERMMLLNRSLIKHKDGKTMSGDTIFYDKKVKYGEGFKNVVLNDTVQKSTLSGDYVYYNEKTEMGLATDSALLTDWSSKDTMYVHADSLIRVKDSTYNKVRGFYHVRFFRNDTQGLCDSLSYSTRDSIMNLHGQPFIWAENNQLSGNLIKGFTKNKKIERIQIIGAAMAVQKEDSIYYNQLSGKEIIALLDSGQVRKVDVKGNAETLYYPKDSKDSTLLGINKTQSSFVYMYLKNKKIERIVLTSASTGSMYPLNQLKNEELYLKNFKWLEKERPTKKEDLFLIFPNSKRLKQEETIPKQSKNRLEVITNKIKALTTKKTKTTKSSKK
jgi:lipopolysaccharide export system protein LptA